jgi:hypothetical protein
MEKLNMTNDQNNDDLEIREAFRRFRKILKRAGRHSTVRQAVIRAIFNLLNRAFQHQNQAQADQHLQEIARNLQRLLNEFTRDELDTIVKIITAVYLKQRQQLEGGDYEIKLDGDRYRIWVHDKRPLTKIEKIIFKWLGDDNHPLAQQLAMQAKVEFANELDKAEEERIKEIRKQLGISNTDLAEIQLAKNRSFFAFIDKIVGGIVTIDKGKYRKVVSNVLPEAFHQDKSQPETVNFLLRKWQDDENSNRKISKKLQLQLGTTSHRLKLALLLAKNPWALILLGLLPVGTVVYSARAGAEYISDLFSETPPPPPPCLPPQEPNKGMFVLPSANVKDIDSSNFDMGTLTVEFSNGATVTDRVWIHNQSNNQGEIGIDCKNNVTYGGEVIGKVEGGKSTKPLVVTFNDKSTPDAATALLRNIQYANTSQTPVNSRRELKIQVSDGQENGNSKSITKAINLTTENQSPIVILPTNSQTVKENSKLTIPGIEIRDSDSEKLTVTLSVHNGILTIKPKVEKAIKTDTSHKIEAKNKHTSDPDPAKKVTVKHGKCGKKKIAVESKDKNQQAPKPDAAQKLTIENNNTKTVVLTGTAGEINATLADPNAITYQANKDFVGKDLLTVTVNDNGKKIPGATADSLVYPENALKAKTAENKNAKITVTPLKTPVVIQNRETK